MHRNVIPPVAPVHEIFEPIEMKRSHCEYQNKGSEEPYKPMLHATMLAQQIEPQKSAAKSCGFLRNQPPAATHVYKWVSALHDSDHKMFTFARDIGFPELTQVALQGLAPRPLYSCLIKSLLF
jgi:hypothetical protein